MSRLDKAREFRNRINANLQATRKLIRVDELSEEELTEMIDLYETYEVGRLYKKDEVFRYEGRLYKVLKGLTSSEEWKPDNTPSEYLPLMPENVIPEWVQPTMAEDAYKIGDKVVFENKVYESIIDSNTWSPTSYPQGWQFIE